MYSFSYFLPKHSVSTDNLSVGSLLFIGNIVLHRSNFVLHCNKLRVLWQKRDALLRVVPSFKLLT